MAVNGRNFKSAIWVIFFQLHSEWILVKVRTSGLNPHSLRFSALDWFRAITSRTPPNFQIENQSRFLSEYGLPIGTVDKLAEPGTYPPGISMDSE
jgi:hypothetical protein